MTPNMRLQAAVAPGTVRPARPPLPSHAAEAYVYLARKVAPAPEARLTHGVSHPDRIELAPRSIWLQTTTQARYKTTS
jgi:hypothetical protein